MNDDTLERTKKPIGGTESTPENTASSDDATVFRDDQTVMRATTQSSFGHANTESSWQSSVRDPDADAPKVLKQRFVLEKRIGSAPYSLV